VSGQVVRYLAAELTYVLNISVITCAVRLYCVSTTVKCQLYYSCQFSMGLAREIHTGFGWGNL